MAFVRCDSCDLTLTKDNYISHVNGKKHKQREEKQLKLVDYFRCDICDVIIDSKDNYHSHVEGKKHKQKEETLSVAKNLEITGLYLQGVPRTTTASDLLGHFGRFGELMKVDIHGSKAFLNYCDKTHADEALKHHHVLHGQTLIVSRRRIFKDADKKVFDGKIKEMQQGGSPHFPTGGRAPSTTQYQKRSFDGTLKSPAQPGMKDDGLKVSALQSEILTNLSQAKSVSEQVAMLKDKVLAGEKHCNHVQQSIKQDLMSALQSDFHICELFTFGSMTTGLAFKDSDLDVYAHLVLMDSAFWQFNMPCSEKNFNKIFVVAKKCLYRKGHLFRSIVPLQRIKVPIIKFVHINTQVSCDMSFQNLIGHCNSKLLRHYLDMNERFFELIFFLKYWASVHKFCSTSKLSNFALCMLGLSFLLSLRGSDGKKFLPTVHDLLESGDISDPHYKVENWRCGFNKSPLKLVLPETPEFSLLGLIKKFFEYVSQLPFHTHVISVLTGELIPREMFEQSPNLLPDAYECYKDHISSCPSDVLCKAEDVAVMHDPFLLKHNLIKRVNAQTLQEFIEACIRSAGLCAESLKSNEEQSMLLYQLLCPNSENEKKGGLQSDKVLVLLKEPTFSEKNQFKCVQEVVTSIFERIFLFTVTSLHKEDVINSPEASRKVLKVEEMQDVHEDGFISLFSCEGERDVWTGRKKVRGSLKANGTLTDFVSFRSQQIISENMRNRGARVVKVKFQCKMKRDKSGKILMQFFDMCHNQTFHVLWHFLQNSLSSWISAFSCENSDESVEHCTSITAENSAETVKKCAGSVGEL